MIGNTCEKMMARLDRQGTLHPYAYLLFNLEVEEQPSVVSSIMTQIYLKVGLNTWVENRKKSYEVRDEIDSSP